MRIIVSNENSPLWNSAAERLAMTELSGRALFLYINRPSVCVGRNQTIAAEVDTDYCRQNDIEITRRMSGGGTVYHDLGNVNYAFFEDAERGASLLDWDFTAPIRDALLHLGVNAELGSRKELNVNGLKISGTASHLSRGRKLAHGTLLFDADLDALEKTLCGRSELRGKGVPSVPSMVVNLSTMLPQITSTNDFLERIVMFFEKYYETERHNFVAAECTHIRKLEEIRTTGAL